MTSRVLTKGRQGVWVGQCDMKREAELEWDSLRSREKQGMDSPSEPSEGPGPAGTWISSPSD